MPEIAYDWEMNDLTIDEEDWQKWLAPDDEEDWNGKGKPNADERSIEYRFSASDSVIWNKYI